MLLSALCLLAAAAAHASAQKFVQMRFEKEVRDLDDFAALEKRAGDFSVTLDNPKLPHLYFVNISVGTPAQDVRVQLDTGSSDLWVFGPNSCNTSTADCQGGEYDVTKSSSAQQIQDAPAFQIQYVTPNSGVQGFYLHDTVELGGVSVTSLTMAEATYAAYVPTGIMGVGFDTDESYASGGGVVYPNIVDVMLNQSLIDRRAYSLYLDDRNATTGTLLFGGYDTDKFTGALTPLPLQPDAQSGNITSFTVVFSGLSVTSSSGTAAVSGAFPYPVVLDSGTSLTLLSQDLFDELAQAFAVQSVNDGELYLVNCTNGALDVTLDFQFGGSGGPTIKVPVSEVVIPLWNETTNSVVEYDGEPLCQFGIEPTSSAGIYLFGDTFLRSAYVVYDIDGQQCYIAQSNYDSTSTNIQEIPANGIGNSVSVSSGSYSTETASQSTNSIPTSVAGASTTPVTSDLSLSSVAASSSGGGLLGGGGATSTAASTAAETSAAAATSHSSPGTSGKIHVSRQFGWTEVGLFVVPAVAVAFGAML